jgi:hypothetical protein
MDFISSGNRRREIAFVSASRRIRQFPVIWKCSACRQMLLFSAIQLKRLWSIQQWSIQQICYDPPIPFRLLLELGTPVVVASPVLGQCAVSAGSNSVCCRLFILNPSGCNPSQADLRLTLQFRTSSGENLQCQCAAACLPNHALMKWKSRLVELPAVCSRLCQPPVSCPSLPRSSTTYYQRSDFCRRLQSSARSHPRDRRFRYHLVKNPNSPGRSSNLGWIANEDSSYLYTRSKQRPALGELHSSWRR